MRDDGRFEDRLRDALEREASDLPFRIDAVTIHERLASRSSLPSWLLPVALPVVAAIVVAAVVVNAFPGQPLETGVGPSATTAPEPTIQPSSASPAPATPLPTMHPAAREFAATAAGDGRLFMIGGSGQGGELTSAVVFDGRVWTDLPRLPQSRRGAAGALLPGGRLLVAGGTNDRQPLASTLVLEPDADAWTDGPPMPHAQVYMGSAVIDGRLYLFGGSVAERARDVLILDPDTGTWMIGAPMPIAVSRVAVAVADGAAYLFGGRSEPDGTDLATTFRYDPVTDGWEELADMPGTGSATSATVSGRRVWILGELRPTEPEAVPAEGVTRNGQPSRAWVYELESNTWTVRNDTNFWSNTWHAALLQADGRILIVGGWPNFAVDMVDAREP